MQQQETTPLLFQIFIFFPLLEKQRQLQEVENKPTNLQEREIEEHVANIERKLGAKEEQKANLQRQLMRTEQQLREKNEQLREVEQQMKHFQAQLREKEVEEANLLREKEQQEENSRRQLHEMEQQLTNVQGQLREKDGQLQEKDGQLREKDGQLREKDGQLREKDGQLREKDGQLREKDGQLQEKDGQLSELTQQLTNVQGQLQEKDEQLVNSEGQLREMEEQLANVQGELMGLTQQLTNVQGQLQEKDEEAAILQNQVTTLEGRLRTKHREVNELETSLSTAQQALDERPRQQSPDWVISRHQIQLTDKCLGRGGWGSVVEGKYCGCAVAVKQMYELILSDHNRRLFEREMNIASKCRHPCLLQFIGATNDEGSPLFVTELMESSLRALLEQRSLSKTEVSVISLDVARALNYLHQKEPSPIIHRDISSANVLLWRQADQWRGKVSDYGTANFMQQTMTVGPGAMIYSAPEALTKSQTIKVCLIYIFTFIFFDLLFVFTVTDTLVNKLKSFVMSVGQKMTQSLRATKPTSSGLPFGCSTAGLRGTVDELLC